MLTRRGFLVGSLAGATSACVRSSQAVVARPLVTHGAQIGDVQSGRALVWARCSEPARMLVEWDTTDRFATPRRVVGPLVTPDGDGGGVIAIDGLPDAQTVAYRVRFEREAARGASEWTTGTFATPRSDHFRMGWTGDTCGQGFGRNPEWGGLKGYAALHAQEPAFWVNSGDLIYADNPILAEQKLADGRVWKNVTNELVGKVAESLAEFRGRFQYNLEDDHVRALAASVPVVAQWDDHETHNNWWPGEQLDDDRYTNKDASTLAARARRAMFEWMPLSRGPVNRVIHYGPLLDVVVLDCRAFRTPNDAGIGTAMLGAQQAAWLVDALAGSQARWKVVACDQPIGLVIGDGPGSTWREGFADGVAGPPGGREIELAALLAGMKQRGVQNVVWITADVHYAAAHHFDPNRGTGVDFTPFWEFVAGPIHAGTFGPEVLDSTLGPEAKFIWAPPPGTGNLPPWDGLQTFGTVDVQRDALGVSLWGIADRTPRYRVEIPFVGG